MTAAPNLPKWEAFATPPAGSRLAEIVASLEKSAADSPEMDHPRILYPTILARLHRAGMPEGAPPAWLRPLIAEHLKMLQSVMRLFLTTQPPPPADAPNTFAAAVAWTTFMRLSDESPTQPLDRLFAATAETLGPGIGVGEVDRLVRYVLHSTRNLDDKWLAARGATYAEVSRWLGTHRTTIHVTDDELAAIAGVLDQMRLDRAAA